MIPQTNNQKTPEHGTYWLCFFIKSLSMEKKEEELSVVRHFGDNQGNVKNGQDISW